MTTIVIDLDNGEIAADRQRTAERGDIISRESVPKIHHISPGVVFTACGCSSEIEEQLKNFKSLGRLYNTPDGDVKIAICTKKGNNLIVDIYSYKPPGLLGKFFKCSGTFKRDTINGGGVITLGSGGDYALGAFKAGKSAGESVRTASMCDEFTSYEVDVFKFDTCSLETLDTDN